MILFYRIAILGALPILLNLPPCMAFANLNGFKKYFSNTFWILLERAMRFSLGLLIGIYVARYLGPDLFGLYNFAVSFAGLFIILSTLGLDKIVIKSLVRADSSEETILGTSLLLKFAGAVSGVILTAICIQFFNADEAKFAVYLVSLSSIFQTLNCIDFYFQAKVQVRYVAIIKIIQSVIGALTKLALIILAADFIYFIWVLILEAAILAFGLVYVFQKNVGNLFSWNWDSKLAINLLKYSWPLVLSTLFIAINMRVDQILLQQLMGSEAVGLYAAASRLSEASYNVCVLVVASVFPAIVNSKSIDMAMYENRIKNLYSLMFFMALFIAIFITIVAEPLMTFLYGIAYLKSAQVFAIHIWTGIFVYWGIVMNQWAIMENKQKHMALFMFMGILANIILNLLLVPSMGINGAAYATLISQILANMIMPLFFGKQFIEQIKIQLTSMWNIPMVNKIV